MIQASVDIMKEDGPEALLGGLGPTVVGYGIEGAMKFGVYEVMKPVFKALLSGDGGGDGKQALAYLMASIVAGAVAAMLLCPMESTRIKIVTDPSYSGKSFLPAFSKLINEEGFLSTFGGIWAMLAKQVPYTFGKQVSFDMFASALYIFLHSLQENVSYLTDSTVKWAVSVIAAFCASIVACIFSQPGDMILTETYRPQKAAATGKGGVKPPQTTFTQIVGSLYKEGGVSQFFTGTQARIVHVGLIITSQVSV
jgi:solute carrier family 25 (mitochondrial phosphate transporter), member 3